MMVMLMLLTTMSTPPLVNQLITDYVTVFIINPGDRTYDLVVVVVVSTSFPT